MELEREQLRVLSHPLHGETPPGQVRWPPGGVEARGFHSCPLTSCESPGPTPCMSLVP